jgi:hypothetical protein
MGFTTESMPAAPTARALSEPAEFDLPVKEFVGYDPKGTTSVTGSPLAQKTNQPVEPTEPAVAPVAEVPPEESVTLSPKVSAIARKEAALRQREKELKEKDRTFAEKMADAEKYQQLKAKLAAKDYSAAEELGLTYDEYVKHELNKEAAKDPATERVAQLEEKLTALQKAQEENVVKEYQANQNLWKQEIVKTVKENDEFSTVRELGAEDIVLQHINDSFEEDNIELTVEQAAKDIEDALLARAEKFASVSKIKNKVPENKVLGAPKTSKVSTITQNMTTTPKTVATSKPFHLMSESEQIAEAIRRVQAAKLQR